MKQALQTLSLAGALVAAHFAGCGSSDYRTSELARSAMQEQAEQNRRTSDAGKAVADGAKRLVEAESQARQDLIALQQDLRQDQAEVGKQRDALETERISLNGARQRESTVAAVILSAGILLACLSPLVLAGIALRHLWLPTTQDEMREVLIEELADVLTQPAADGLPGPASRSQLPAAEQTQL